MSSLAIVFGHHGRSEVAQQHLDLFRAQNPDATLYPISFAEAPATGVLAPLIASCRSRASRAWRECDLLLYQAWLDRPREHDRWLYVDWDTYCAMPVAEFFRETWHFDAVGGTICLPDREPEWIWFGERHRLPPPLRRFACGMKPSSCSLFSSRALAAMVELLSTQPFSVLSELRLGTLAAAAGFLPVPNPRSNATISWRPQPEMPLVNGIFHPVKHLPDKRDNCA